MALHSSCINMGYVRVPVYQDHKTAKARHCYWGGENIAVICYSENSSSHKRKVFMLKL